VPSEAQSGIAQIGAGYFHTCSVSTAGAVICWGYNADQQATVPAGLGSVTEVSAGFYHTCALTTAGAVTCWGDNGAGQTNLLGAAQSGIAHIDAGGYHTCALSTAGVVNCWGFNNSGQSSAPPTLTVMKQVSAGGIHSCEVSTAGAVTCWGNNGNGQTTVPTLPGGTTHLFPTATFAAPATVVAGQSITLALTDAQVPGHPEATRFTYAFDCGSGAFAAVTSSSTASCATSVAGPRTVRGQVIDQDQDATPYSAVVTVLTPTQATQQLRAAVAASGISAKVAAGLIDKLDAALTALGRGQTATALSQLAAFQQLVMAQRGKAIPAATADAWLAQSAAIRQALGG
jgi:alpha-tubulin suppressor-like RCC1 family protein